MKKIFALLALAAITLFASPPAAAQSSTKAVTKASVPKANVYKVPATLSVDSSGYFHDGIVVDSARKIYFTITKNGTKTAAPRIQVGTGTPLNAISAPVGSVYLRTDGGTSTTIYIKTAGVDSAGWTPK